MPIRESRSTHQTRTRGETMSTQTPPLSGEWRHGSGYLMCGTFRIAKADFDTDPSDEWKARIFDWMVAQLNAKHAPAQSVNRELEKALIRIRDHVRGNGDNLPSLWRVEEMCHTALSAESAPAEPT